MKGKDIESIVLRLDKDRAYFQLESKGKAKRRKELSLAERLAMADSDPAFLWNLAVSDALAGQPLPTFVCNSAALRANCFYLCSEHPDVHIAVVQSLGLPKMKPRNNLLRALICCADISLEGIAQECGLEVDEVRLYSELRWNFRNRVSEGLYVAQLLYPETRFAEPAVRRLEQANAGLRLCRLGYEKGYRPVLQAAGPGLLEESLTQVADRTRKVPGSIMTRAGLGFDMGLTSSESNCELKLAQQTKLLSVEKLGHSTDDLSAMSVSTAFYTSFMRMMQPDLEARLAFQQGLMEEAPNTSEKRPAETASIEPNQLPSGQAEGHETEGHEQLERAMAETTVIPNAPEGTPTDGDPSLGPNDIRLHVELVLVSKDGVPVRQEAGLKLSNALTPAAKEAVAAAIQSTMELMRQSAIAQLSEAILRRCPEPKQERGRINRGGNHQNPRHLEPVPPSPAQGDPTLGPNDVRLETRLLLAVQQAKLCEDQASARLPEVLTLPARGAAAAAIESSLEVLLRNALAQITQAVDKRCPKITVSKPFDHNSPIQDDFPTVLPSPPKKTQPSQASPGS